MDDCIMFKLIHSIDVNGTLKVTQGQRQNVKIKHAFCDKLRRNLYIRGVKVLVIFLNVITLTVVMKLGFCCSFCLAQRREPFLLFLKNMLARFTLTHRKKEKLEYFFKPLFYFRSC